MTANNSAPTAATVTVTTITTAPKDATPTDRRVFCDKTDEEYNNTSRNAISPQLTATDSDEATAIPTEQFISAPGSSETLPVQNKKEDNSVDPTLFPKDGVAAWIACLVAVLDQLCLFGTLNIYSLFLVRFQMELNCTTAEAAWLGSMTMGLLKLFGPLASSLSMKLGNRKIMVAGCVICCGSMISSSFVPTFRLLFLTMCVPYALGAALVVTPAHVVPMEYFKKYQSLTMGIVAAGSSLGTLILAPSMGFVLEKQGWRMAFRYLASAYFLLIFVNTFIRPRKRNPVDYIQKPILRSFIEDLTLWKNRVFVLWVIAIAIVYFGYQIPVIFLASYAVHLGSTPTEASHLFIVVGASTTVSRLVTGSLLRCDLLSRLHLKQIIFVLMGTSYLLLTHIKTMPGLYIFALLRGFLDGAHIVMLPMLTASMVGAKNAILGWGHLAGAISVTYTFGPLLAGALKDYTQDYVLPFIMAGIPLIIAGLLLFLLPWAQRTSMRTNILKQLKKIDAASKPVPETIDILRSMGTTIAVMEDDNRSLRTRISMQDDDSTDDLDDPMESIHDFIQFHAVMSELSRASGPSQKSLPTPQAARSVPTPSPEPRSTSRFPQSTDYQPLESNDREWQRPLSTSQSDSKVERLHTKQHETNARKSISQAGRVFEESYI